MHAPLPWPERQHPRAAPAFDKEGPLAGRVQVQSVECKAMQRAERELMFLSSIASRICLSAHEGLANGDWRYAHTRVLVPRNVVEHV